MIINDDNKRALTTIVTLIATYLGGTVAIDSTLMSGNEKTLHHIEQLTENVDRVAQEIKHNQEYYIKIIENPEEYCKDNIISKRRK